MPVREFLPISMYVSDTRLPISDGIEPANRIFKQKTAFLKM